MPPAPDVSNTLPPADAAAASVWWIAEGTAAAFSAAEGRASPVRLTRSMAAAMPPAPEMSRLYLAAT